MIDPIYESRFEILITEITDFSNQVDMAVDRSSTIRDLADCLVTFANAQYAFFKDGFYDHNIFELEERNTATSYTKEYVFGRLIRQITADYTVLRRAYFARKDGPPAHLKTLARADILAHHALQLAKDGGLINEQTTVLTYFQKTAFVRIIPYAPVAIVGIPVTCIDNDKNFRDFLAIPHEIGHYVYWHARQNNKLVHPGNDSRLSVEVYNTVNNVVDRELNRQIGPHLAKLAGFLGTVLEECGIDPDLLEELHARIIHTDLQVNGDLWLLEEVLNLDKEQVQCVLANLQENSLFEVFQQTVTDIRSIIIIFEAVRQLLIKEQEEIFADVYGTMVAGPAIALEFQDLLFDNYLLYEDDGQHPIPAARPFIYTKTLELLKDVRGTQIFPKSSDWLNTQWTNKLLARNVPMTSPVPIRMPSLNSPSVIQKELSSLRADYEILVEELLVSLKAYFPAFNTWTSDKNIVDDVYADFNNFLITATTADPVNTLRTKLNFEFDKSWDTPNFYFDYLYQQFDAGTLDPSGTDCDGDGIADSEFCYKDWETLISQSGWTIGGPEQDGSSPP